MVSRYCYYCGNKLSRKTATKDHIHPRSKGGSDDESNIVACCRDCNEAKGSLKADEYRAVMAFRDGVSPLGYKFPGERVKPVPEQWEASPPRQSDLEISLDM